MPVYNGEKYLRESIESILNQTYSNFEFLIINDGSTDNSEKIIKSYNDKRIRLIKNSQNIKLSATLNKGIDMSQGEYIVRMDCDDISLPNRLAIQVKYMDENPNIGVCGSFVDIFYEKNLWLHNIVKYPVTDAEIKETLFFQCAFSHPTVIIRKKSLNYYNLSYNPNYSYAQDYKLWIDCSKYLLFANIPQVLLRYRRNAQSISISKRIEQMEIALKISNELLEYYSFKSMQPIEPILLDMIKRKYISIDKLKVVHLWFWEFSKKRTKKFLNLEKTAVNAWFCLCTQATYLGYPLLAFYLKSYLGKRFNKMSFSFLKFFVKCLSPNSGFWNFQK
jgi:glycosyltransferase involved in cell wall biosynthesis